MDAKKYTLCFKGKNKYGHERELPIVTLSLRQMDELTSNYDNYLELFNALPFVAKNFITENLSSGIKIDNLKQISSRFVIKDDDSLIENVVFSNNIDVLGVSQDRLCSLLLDEKISNESFQRMQLKTRNNSDLNKQYKLFNYLYENYVKGKKIEKMIDTYYTKRQFPCLNGEDLVIATIATDSDSIKIITKKLGQSLKNTRDVLFLLKNVKKDKSFLSKEEETGIKRINMEDVLEQIDENIEKFKKDYFKEYEIIA